jgi:GrpB-like predicted nucleotidyltransferase (UPF0157 family)
MASFNDPGPAATPMDSNPETKSQLADGKNKMAAAFADEYVIAHASSSNSYCFERAN